MVAFICILRTPISDLIVGHSAIDLWPVPGVDCIMSRFHSAQSLRSPSLHTGNLWHPLAFCIEHKPIGFTLLVIDIVSASHCIVGPAILFTL